MADLKEQTDMRKGTQHTPETRLAIRLNRLQKSMPPEEFARFMASDGALKWCPTCRQLLSISEFQRSRATWDGLYGRCKKCNAAAASEWHSKKQQDPEHRQQKSERAKAWREANKDRMPELNKKYSLRQLYGLEVEEYEAIMDAQGGRCAICVAPFEDSRDAHVDHDHDSGHVRGLLCNNCNNGLGRFKDDPAVLRRAADYLESATARRADVALPAGDGRGELRAGNAS